MRHQRHDRAGAGEGSLVDAQPSGPGAVAGPDLRDALAHLAADWDARAAQIERGDFVSKEMLMNAATLRECAELLRDRLGLPGHD
jgi:hypothetical protein